MIKNRTSTSVDTHYLGRGRSLGSCFFSFALKTLLLIGEIGNLSLYKSEVFFMPVREGAFQAEIIKDLEKRFPGCVVLKNDCNYLQGIPDLSVFYGPRWAVLECKRSAHEPYGANQEYYLDLLDEMSFASMICPENKEEILHALQRSFASSRSARILKC